MLRYWKLHPEKIRKEVWKYDLRQAAKLLNVDFDSYLCLLSEGCMICGRIEKLCVDHNHKTRKGRGILCGTCNTAISLLGDDRSGVYKAIIYLQTSEGYS